MMAVGGGSGRTKPFSVFGWGAGKAEIVRFLLSDGLRWEIGGCFVGAARGDWYL